MVFQDYKLLPNRTVYDNVAYSLQVIGEPRQEIRRKVPDILRLVGLSTKLHNFPDELSGGEQQRVSIARAFVNHPPLLLADEPTGNLDPETSIGIMQLIYRINRTGTTVVVATHDNEMVDKMRRRVVELREGRIVRDELSGLYRPDESTTEFAVRLRGELGVGDEGHPELAMRSGFFLREALRGLRRSSAPALAALLTVLLTALVLGVFIPIVQATTGTANEVRSRVVVDVYVKDSATQLEQAELRKAIETTDEREVGRVHLEGARHWPAPRRRTRRRSRPARSCSARTRCRHLFRVTPRGPGQARRDRHPRSNAGRRAAARRRSTRCATARTRRTRSSRPPGS